MGARVKASSRWASLFEPGLKVRMFLSNDGLQSVRIAKNADRINRNAAPPASRHHQAE
jgi:hypothetical protein